MSQKPRIQIGPYTLDSRVVLAPMAGVTDRPFRQLCRNMGAGMVASEMITSDSSLWNTRKSQWRMNREGDREPHVVQIAGSDPEMMAEAARLNVELGAQIIDINMGCPAKKVCKKAAGSALLKDEKLVEKILTAVSSAVSVPVTLKIRTGWDTNNRNAVVIARMAEDCGIKALAVHGRTRSCRFVGNVEYDTIAAVKQAVSIPIFANGDIKTPKKAKEVLDQTGADGIMVGRGAQGRPWVFREICSFLNNELHPNISMEEMKSIVINHLMEIHRFYGDYMGLRISRKHFGWYTQYLPDGRDKSKRFNQLITTSEQLASAQDFFERLIEGEVMAA